MNWNRATGLVVLAALSSACSMRSGQSGDPDLTAPPTVLQVHTAQGAYSSVFPATVNVNNGPVPSIELSIEAGRSQEMWGAFAKLPRTATIAGSVAVLLQIGALVEGTGTVTLSGGDAGVEATSKSGALEITIVKGKVTGSVHGASALLDATFEGEIGIECSVPAHLLPSSSGGATADPGYNEPLSLDEKFITPQCAPFKQLMP